MNKNLLIGIVVLVLLALGGYYFLTQQGAYQTPTPTVTQSPADTDTTTPEAMVDEGETTDEEDVVIINIEGFEFGYSLEEISVNEGDTVRVVFENTGTMPHNFIIDEFDVATQTILPGSTDTVEFVADVAGNFSFYCSVGNHRQLGMEGVLTVE